jgi:hypothetical protein
MNKKIIITFLFSLAVLVGHAQKKMSVSESTQSIADGKNNALVIILFEIEEDEVQKSWKKQLKDFGKVKTKKNTFYVDEASHKKMGDKVFYLHSFTEKTKEGIKLVVAIDLGGAFLNSKDHKEQFNFMEKYLHDFAIDAVKESIEDKQKEAEKVLGKMEKDLKGLEKDKDKLESDIKDYEKKIEKAKKDIEKNEKDQKEQQKKIEEQKKAVSEIEKKKKLVK